MIESRNRYRLGLPADPRGANTAMNTISRLLRGAQATCMAAGPGSESGAEAYGGILESWESRADPWHNYRIGTTPVYQRPGARATLSAAGASEIRKAAKDSGSEGNRSERGNGGGSLSGLIVAVENRVTNRREPVSSEGDRRGEERAIGRDVGEFQPQSNVSPRPWHIVSGNESSP